MKKITFIIPVVLLSLIACGKSSDAQSETVKIDYTMTKQEFMDFISSGISFTATETESSSYISGYANGKADYSDTEIYQRYNDLNRYYVDINEYITFTTQDYADWLKISFETAESYINNMNDTECVDAELGIWKKLDKNGAPKDTTQKKIGETYYAFDNLEMTYKAVPNNHSIFEEEYESVFYTLLFDFTTYNESEHYYEINDMEILEEYGFVCEEDASAYIRFYFEDKKPTKIVTHITIDEKYHRDETMEFSNIGTTTIELNEANYSEPEEN